MVLFDSHCHLQDPRLASLLPEALRAASLSGIRHWMTNGTRETDWPAVATLAQTFPGIRPSFGLHPWFQKERSPEWLAALTQRLLQFPSAGIGETGLDRWMPLHDLEDQQSVLFEHLQLAHQLQRPLSLHCLRAWNELHAFFRNHPPPPRGFLLHSYAAPPEMTPFWIRAGAYFSLSPAQLAPNKSRQRAAFSLIPLDRLLIETDAPDMPPPASLNRHPLLAPESTPLNHPLHLHLCLQALASDHRLPPEKLAEILLQNALRLFGPELQTPPA
jgi:TatD DNase family protein